MIRKATTLQLARRCVLPIAIALSLVAAPAANATLIGDSVTATLSSPNGIVGDSTPINESDTVSVGGGIEISAGDGSNIGNWMLPGGGSLGLPLDSEFIDFQASSILVRVVSGSAGSGPNGDIAPFVTGYETGAQYIFSGLNDSVGTITGISFAVADASAGQSAIVNLATLPSDWIKRVDANTISLALDQLEFFDRGNGTSNNFADITVNLIVQQPPTPAPEPGSLALLGAGVWVLFVTRRRRK